MDEPLAAIDVLGQPAPQGSKSHVGGGRMIESSKAVAPWREAVKWAAARGRTGHGALTGPLHVSMDFYLDRPKGHYGTGRNAGTLRASAPARPTTKPDLDKLQRSTLDALVDAGVMPDDSVVVKLEADKYYANRERPPGARILIWEAT